MSSDQERLVAGRYRLLSSLGAGGMGTVWRAHDEVLGREVAVKEVTFPQGLSEDDRAVLRERTRREARAAARLDHPSAVTVYDVVEHEGSPYLVMELVEARTLSEVVRTDGPMSPQRTAQIGLDLLGALSTAHRQGIVHRDVKPSNVLVRADGRVVLTDFGIATTTGDPSITSTGLLLGSPAYIAPERARGGPPGPPSDLWSLGATLFTAVEGRPPYDGDEPLTTVTAVVMGEHAPYAAAGPLETLLDGLLVKDPAERLDADAARPLLEQVADSGPADPPPTVVAPAAAAPAAGVSALEIGEVQEEIAAAEPAPAASPPRAEPGPSRRRAGWLVPVAVVLVLLGLGAAGLALTTGDDGQRTTAGPSASPAPTEAPPTSAAPSPSGPETSEPETSEPETSPSAPAPDAAPAGGGVPAGWSTDTGGAGWTVALPPGYAQTRAGEYRDADTGRTLRIETGEGQPDAVADRERQEESFAEEHPSYERIRIEPADYRGYEAADWEFTYEGLHVLNRVFVVDGVGHSLFFQTDAGDFSGARADFSGIADAFEPVGR